MASKRATIGRWLVRLGVLGVVAGASFLWGFVARKTEIPPYRTVWPAYHWLAGSPSLQPLFERFGLAESQAANWRLAARSGSGEPPPAARRGLKRLATLGYLSGYEAAGDAGGVTVHDPGRAYQGLNLYTSGHRPEAILMDMEGRPVHRWRLPWEEAFPDSPTPPGLPGARSWRRVHLLENGDLLAIFDGLGLMRIDRDSKLLWARDNRSHHDLDVDPDGRIYVLTRQESVAVALHEWKPVVEDFISVLAPDGTDLGSASVLEAFVSSHYASALDYVDLEAGRDFFHTNTIELLDGRHGDHAAAFGAGNALISVPKLNLIAIVDLQSNEVVWLLAGLFSFQHEPTLLDNGNLLVFDNYGHRGWSKVVELDPLTQEIVWGYFGDPENGFYSSCCGASRRLPNGNTLITETTTGRAFEVAPDGSTVWEFFNPHRAGAENELIASLWEVQRLAPESTLGWPD